VIISIFIEPHERYDAIEAYRNRLSTAQIEEIEDAPDEALIRLKIDSLGTHVQVIEEG